MKLLLAILICAVSASAQNCTTQPAMNTMTMTIAGANAVVGNTTNNTITVNLDAVWTSNTGYVTVFTNSGSYAAPGNNGSYQILSGNGTAQIVLDASAPSRVNGGTTTAGGQSGRYVSDLGVIRNSARNYTFVWSTPGFNSDTWVSYGDDVDTGAGVVWRTTDTVNGVINHSITVDNLDPFYVNGAPNGIYHFTVWSDCFTAGVPDISLSAHMPQGTVSPNQSGYAGGSMKILTTLPDYTGVPLNIFTLDGYNDSPTCCIFIPPQDGSHPGFRAAPGGYVTFPMNFQNTTWPAATVSGDNAVNVNMADWVAPSGGVAGLISTLNVQGYLYNGSTTAWTGQSFPSRASGASLTLAIPANTPTTAPCGNMAGAQAITIDGGTLPACAYPLKVTGSRWWSNSAYICGTNATCGPPGTPATPIANVPFVAQVWLIVYNPVGLVSTGTVGAWINPYTMMPGIACELYANIAVDKANAVYPNPGCVNHDAGPVGINGNKFTYQGATPGANGLPAAPAGQPYGGQETNCAFNGQRNENSYVVNSQPLWFYDAGWVCHTLDVLFPQTAGGNNDEYEKHILGIYWEQASYARVNDPIIFASYTTSGPPTINSNLMCATIAPGLSSNYCDTVTFPVNGDVSAIQTGLASGQRFRLCQANSYYCMAFPYSAPSQSASTVAGGTLAASTVVGVIRSYTDANNLFHSTTPAAVAVTVDSTCPTSGNCSVGVTSPGPVPNAPTGGPGGYDVYARINGTGAYYRQNTTGPIPIGTAFVIGTATNPLQTTGPTFTSPGGTHIMNIIAADNVAHTLTINSAWGGTGAGGDAPPANMPVMVMRQFAGIPADTGTSAQTLICNTCTFTGGLTYSLGTTGLPNSAVVYCNVSDTGDAGAPLYSNATSPGSTISSIPSVHQINLTTAINCAPGAHFEIRMRRGQPSGVRIFNWPNTPYDVWKRFGNYIAADSVLWGASATNVTGASAPCCDSGANPSYRREVALALLACHRAINLMHDLTLMGTTTALAATANANCISPTVTFTQMKPYPAFTMIENMTAANYGRGTSIGSFLNGVLGYALIDWWQDPYMGVTNDPQFPYWTKRLTDALWTYYSVRNSYGAWCQPSWPHEWAYLMEDIIVGVCPQSNGNYKIVSPDGTSVPVNDYWSIMGNILPLYAFFYQFTGNATIPQVGGMVRPPWKVCYPLGGGTGTPGCGSYTYGQAYNDMANWIFVHMASTPAWSGAGAKTLGEMGIWQDRAIGWMGGNGGGPPSTLNIITSSLPAAQVTVPYTASMAATGGITPYVWTSNVMPPGLTMSTSGTISGTPTAYGTTNIIFTVTDSTAPTPHTATITIPLTVTSTVPVSAYPAYQTGLIP